LLDKDHGDFMQVTDDQMECADDEEDEEVKGNDDSDDEESK